jgi:hypothetical protein
MTSTTIEGLQISLVIILAWILMAPILYWSLLGGQHPKH